MPPSSQQAIDALIAADGNRHLAAEKLGLTPSELTSTIASDPQAPLSLNTRLRTLAILDAFQTLSRAHIALGASLADLEPKDLVKLVSSLTDALDRLTDSHTSTQNVNVVEVALRMLPAEVREAMMEFLPQSDETRANQALPVRAAFDDR